MLRVFKLFIAAVVSGVMVAAVSAAPAQPMHDLGRLAERTYHVPQETLAALAVFQAAESSMALADQALVLEISSRARLGVEDFSGALADARRLEALGRRVGNPSYECLAMLQQAYAYFGMGKVKTSHEFMRRAQRFSPSTIGAAAAVKMLLAAAQTQDELQRHAQGQLLAAEALRIATVAKDANLLFLATKLQAERAIAAHDFAHAAVLVRRAVELARQSPYRERLVRAKQTEFRFASASGATVHARRAMDESIGLMKELQLDELLGYTLLNYADLQLKSSRWDDAAALAQEALLLKSVSSDASLARVAHFNHAIASIRLGKLAEGKQEVERLFTATTDRLELLDYLPEYIATLTAAGDIDAAVGAAALLGQLGAHKALQRDQEQDEARARMDSLASESRSRANEASIERAKRNSWQLAAMAAAAGIVGMLFIYGRLRASKRFLVEANRQLFIAGNRDYLTGLFNRRYLEDLAVGMLETRSAEGPGASGKGLVFLIDVDHFKRINDTYGHAVGDRVLKGVAERLSATFGDDGIVARWGGEEFLALAPATRGAESARIACAILDAVSASPIVVDTVTVRVTVSIGISRLQPARAGRAATWEDTLQLADERLYLAKQAGRNRAYAMTDACDATSVQISRDTGSNERFTLGEVLGSR